MRRRIFWGVLLTAIVALLIGLTAAAVIRRRGRGDGEILSNIVRAQLDEHRAFGGVVPEIAARAHVEVLDALVKQALSEAGIGFEDLDAVAATAGPGLIGGLMVGLATAKAIAVARSFPARTEKRK